MRIVSNKMHTNNITHLGIYTKKKQNKNRIAVLARDYLPISQMVALYTLMTQLPCKS